MRSQAPCQKDDFMERNSSRRSFLKGSALTGAAYVLGRRVLARPNPLSVIVVGAGAFGGWTALELLRKGAKVVLVEAWGPGNSRASSGGETRIIRATYGPSRIYTQMAAQALRLWQENEQRWGLKLFFPTGVLWMRGKDRQAQAAPGRITGNRMEGIILTPGESLTADAYVFACGPWLGTVFSFLASLIRATRQEVFFLGTAAGDVRFTDAQLPVWIDNSRRGEHFYYGIPGNHWRGFKIADDTRGPVVDPTTMERQISPAGLAAGRKYVSMRFPGLADAPLLESRVCQYENSADQNFILDRHPEAANVWIVGGGSGHGFKHGPAIGKLVSDAVLGIKAPPAEFLLGRLVK